MSIRFLIAPDRLRNALRLRPWPALLSAALLLAAAAPVGADEERGGGRADRGLGAGIGGGLGLSAHVFQGLEAYDAADWQVRAEAGFELGERETIDGDGTSGMLSGESIEVRPWALRFGMAARRYVSPEFYLSGGVIAVCRILDLEERSESGVVQTDETRWSLEAPFKAGIEFGASSDLSAFLEGGWIVRPDKDAFHLPIGRYSVDYGLPGSDWTIGAGISYSWRR